MSNYNSLKATINANIKANGNEEITGPVLNSVLTQIVNSFGEGYLFAGIATPSTDPGEPDQRLFYLAFTGGTYTDFGGIEVADNEVAILRHASSWTKLTCGVATAAEVARMWRAIGEAIDRLEADFYTITEDTGSTPDNLSGQLTYSESRAIYWASGGTYPSEGYDAALYVDISAYRAVIYSRPKSTTASTPMGMAFYDADKNYISGQQAAILSPADSYIRTFIVRPFAAKYIRINRNKDTAGWGEAYLYGCTSVNAVTRFSEIQDEIDSLDGRVADVEGEVFIRRESGRVETDLSSQMPPLTSGRGINWQSGNTYSSASYSASTYIDIRGYDKIRYSRAKSTSASTSLGMAFYDSAQHFISGQQAAIMSPADSYIDTELDLPPGAAYARISRNNDTSTWGEAYIYGVRITYERISRLGLMQDEIDAVRAETGDALVLDQSDIVELNVVNPYGGVSANSSMGCTDFIPCQGADILTYKRVTGLTGAGLAFYDSGKNFISGSYVDSVAGSAGMVTHSVTVPSNARYFRASGWNYANSVGNGAFSASLSGSGICAGGKRASNGEPTYFSVVYNSAIDNMAAADFSAPSQGESLVCTTGVVLLPDNYSLTGKPSRVIVNFHGWSHYVHYKQWGAAGSEYAGFMMQKERWAAAGYAVVDVNHKSSSQGGNYSGLGSKQDDECYRRALQWVKERYNVEETCFIVCGSAGGINGINACYDWPDVRAAVWLDTWFSVAANPYPNSCGTYYYGYSGEYDAAKVGTRDPALRIKSVGGSDCLQMPQCPVKMYPLNRTSAGFLKPVLDVINAGNAVGDFQVRTTTGITHAVLVSGGDGTDPQAAVVDAEIIRWLDQH